MSIDFRTCLYALSDVIINRPAPLRRFDQIYMQLPDMLLQAEVMSRWFDGKKVLFIGDGDAIGLSIMHLSARNLLPGKPAGILVLDFDERVVNSVNRFAKRYGIADRTEAELYNVADPLPMKHWQAFDAFYTNPPWGASNEGKSVTCFAGRGIEGVRNAALGCIVIGNHPEYPWTHRVQVVAQRFLLGRGFRVTEMLPEFHRYHLDDAPDITSCCIIVKRDGEAVTTYDSEPLDKNQLANFYGQNSDLQVRYVRDLTNGAEIESRDIEFEPMHRESSNAAVAGKFPLHEGGKPR
jgi:N4-bis(aminopropyl)spermidine synthase